MTCHIATGDYSRREFVLAMAAAAWGARRTSADDSASLGSHNSGIPSIDRCRGLLIGGLLGDALGGPVEFMSGQLVDDVLPNARAWPSERMLDEHVRSELARSLKLLGYEQLRPESAPYGPWRAHAPAGTVTDDSRFKIVLMRTLAAAVKHNRFPMTPSDLARQLILFQPRLDAKPTGELARLCAVGLREFRYAAQWQLGNRDPREAKPVERLWAGLATCSGQMMMPPLAVAFAGQPRKAYLATYALDFTDAPIAKDITSALVGGLAAVLDPELDSATTGRRWQVLLETMREVDPYRIADVPFAGRPLIAWLDRAQQFAERAKGRPSRLYRLLETEGKPVYWWDAHFTLLVPLTMLHFCDFDPLSAMHLTLDFRHDTDSYAQVLGCLAGAVCGEAIFPTEMRRLVTDRLEIDFGERLADWMVTLDACAQRHRQGLPLVDWPA